MSEVQRMIFDPQIALQQLRQDAKTDGFNVDALNLLTQVRSKNPPDAGTRVLNDLVAYAISTGVEFDQIASKGTWERTENQHVTSNLAEEKQTSLASQRRFDHIRLSAQLALGAILSAAMLWYLQ